MNKVLKLDLTSLIMLSGLNISNSSNLEKGFVYLKDIDPTIQIDLRYFSEENFVGGRIDGYHAPIIVMTQQCAEALKKAQEHFISLGYSIVVYDAYRPQSAVNHFWVWAQDALDQKNKSIYYPRVDKEKVFDLDYVVRKSGHSRGSTVDISLLPLGKEVITPKVEEREINGFKFQYLNDQTLDMGGAFDMFDEISHVVTEGLSEQQQKNRNLLQDGMKQRGFKFYKNEW